MVGSFEGVLWIGLGFWRIKKNKHVFGSKFCLNCFIKQSGLGFCKLLRERRVEYVPLKGF